jgi:hypothetical protein
MPRPSRIFSSEECSLRVARRISFKTCSAGAFVVTGFAGAVLRFFIIFNSLWGQDEPQTLRYTITLNCSMGADGGQCRYSPSDMPVAVKVAGIRPLDKDFLP